MRLTILAAFAALLTLLSATSSAAQVFGSREDLQFVAATPLTGADGEALALCHHVNHQVFLFVPVFTSLKGYTWAENSCNTDSFYAFEAFDFTSMQDAGAIPTDVPFIPKLGTGTFIKNVIVGGAGAIIALFMVIAFLRRKYREVMG